MVVSLYANENHSLKLCQSKAKMVRGTNGERDKKQVVGSWQPSPASRRLQVILLDPPLSRGSAFAKMNGLLIIFSERFCHFHNRPFRKATGNRQNKAGSSGRPKNHSISTPAARRICYFHHYLTRLPGSRCLALAFFIRQSDGWFCVLLKISFGSLPPWPIRWFLLSGK